jgi:hypothetical protein
MVHDRRSTAFITVPGVLRSATHLVLVAIPDNLLSRGRPRGVYLANQETRIVKGAEIDQSEFVKLLVLKGNMGLLGFPEYLNHTGKHGLNRTRNM